MALLLVIRARFMALCVVEDKMRDISVMTIAVQLCLVHGVTVMPPEICTMASLLKELCPNLT